MALRDFGAQACPGLHNALSIMSEKQLQARAQRSQIYASSATGKSKLIEGFLRTAVRDEFSLDYLLSGPCTYMTPEAKEAILENLHQCKNEYSEIVGFREQTAEPTPEILILRRKLEDSNSRRERLEAELADSKKSLTYERKKHDLEKKELLRDIREKDREINKTNISLLKAQKEKSAIKQKIDIEKKKAERLEWDVETAKEDKEKVDFEKKNLAHVLHQLQKGKLGTGSPNIIEYLNEGDKNESPEVRILRGHLEQTKNDMAELYQRLKEYEDADRLHFKPMIAALTPDGSPHLLRQGQVAQRRRLPMSEPLSLKDKSRVGHEETRLKSRLSTKLKTTFENAQQEKVSYIII
eukprot:m.126906 g.126906  ORF g.126906 m.126906 type:complete len:353 (+) comp14531_c1_seq1:546-1604(+)